MTTGNLIAIIVGLLIVLAILWFMTRSRRRKPTGNVDRADLERQVAGTLPAAPDHDRVTTSAGVATAGGHAPAAVAADAARDHSQHDTGGDTFAGVSAAEADRTGRAPADTMAAGAAAAAAGTAAAARAGDRGQDDATRAGARATDDATHGATGSFAAPDVPLANTDGDLRSQGGGGRGDEAVDNRSAHDADSAGGVGAAGVAAIAAGIATAGAAVAGAVVASGTGDDDVSERSDARTARDIDADRREVQGTTEAGTADHTDDPSDDLAHGPVGDGGGFDGKRGGEAMTERPRFNPSSDGHPVPGDLPEKATSASAVPGIETPADRANQPVDKHDAGFDGVQGGAGTMSSPDMQDLASPEPALAGDYSVDTGDTVHDVREMMKILNLRESEALRLNLSGSEFEALRRGDRGDIEDERLNIVAERLRRMIR